MKITEVQQKGDLLFILLDFGDYCLCPECEEELTGRLKTTEPCLDVQVLGPLCFAVLPAPAKADLECCIHCYAEDFIKRCVLEILDECTEED